ncbi:MAG TPA: hypothetical protein ENJ64_05850 [Thiotrichales bacterium]|nr:hypothetical protein [Thiotrichales bacterium]
MNIAAPETISCVVLYESVADVEQAVQDLRADNYDLAQVSVAGRSPASTARATEPPVQIWAGLRQLLEGETVIQLPVTGAVSVAGALVGLMSDGFENKDACVITTGIFSGQGSEFAIGLYQAGIPPGSINEYQQAIQAGQVLLLVQGPRMDVEHACAILHNEMQQVTVHSA